MCGIFGLISTEDAAFDVCLGLQHLQHRGQDGAGIVSVDKAGQLYSQKLKGMVRDTFTAPILSELKGDAAIGHTRYATVGDAQTTLQLQPFYSPCMRLATAHNGNIVNYQQVLESLREQHGAKFINQLKSGCDSELIPWLLSQYLQNQDFTAETLLTALKSLKSEIVGSYAVVGLAPELGLFAFRSPLGIRPVIYGKKCLPNGQTSYAIASESAALKSVGFEPVENIEPGQMLVITFDGQIHKAFFTESTPKHCMFEWVYFSRVESELDNLSVYQARFQLGVNLAEQVKAQNLKPDVVMAVPETSRIAAIALAETLGVPYREGLIKNRYSNRTFILDSQQERRQALKNKLFPIVEEISGKKILVVDDSIVRGNTTRQISKMLKQAGANAIYMAASCPPIISPCYFGIDFPNEAELPANNMTQVELQDYLQVDALVYQSMHGLSNALQGKPMCNACLTGDYPVDISHSANEFTQKRIEDRQKKHEKQEMLV